MHRDDLASTLFWSRLPSSLQYPVPAACGLPGTVILVPAQRLPADLVPADLAPADLVLALRLEMAKALGAIASLAPWLKQIAYQSH